MNIALLGKLIWQILQGKDKPWVRALDFCRDDFDFRLASSQSSLWFSDWSRQGKLCNKVSFVHVSDLELQVRDIWDGSHWILEHLYTVLPEEVRSIILQSQGPSNSLLPDDWFWLCEVNGIFSVSSCYKWLVHRLRALPTEDSVWKKVWSLKLPEKLKFFVWQCFHDALPTNQKHSACHLSPSPSCPRCLAPVEDLTHCLRGCPHARELWMRSDCVSNPDFFSFDARGNDEMSLSLVPLPGMLTSLSWSPPEPDWFKINVDGSFILRTQLMGAGGLIRDSFGRWIWGFRSFEEVGDALLVELLAILRGL
ncbi:Reverse transcriptase zinc-binding domain [Sesbania bispinosa]|nr:Reverse transcriptase zinc-binding domain [Sesbania bispinosa]